ncbi:MAG TPA: hypothetical protein VGJ48_08960, partial [Pyrinomonadaceae bacterium]
ETVTPDNQVGASLTEFLRELRQSIFTARSGDCRNEEQLRTLYAAEPALSTEYLSHIVSCSHCLDEINALLGLPSLAERFPMETFGRDPKPPGGSGPGDEGGGGMSGGKTIDKLKQVSRRRMTDVLEHRPKELRVAVNGYVLGSQSVSAESNKLALSVNLNERVGFVEVFSEQGFCLMFSNVGAPPDGALEQESHVELSEGRTLDLNLNFTGPWPTVDVVYHDPTFGGESGVSSLESGVPRESESGSLGAEAPSVPGKRKSLWMRSRSWLDSRLRTLDWRLFLRPSVATAVVAILVISAFFIVKLRRGPETPLTTAALLSRASAVEDTIATSADQVLHHTINFEEKKASGEVIARRRIESWQSAQRGVTARRLYDERGALIAGDWRRADGVQTIYHHGQRPQLQIRNPQSAIRNFEDVWQLSLSAKEFNSLIGTTDQAHIEESATSYSIKYAGETDSPGLIKATLVLSRSDLHPLEESLTVRQGSEVREYSFVETSYERRPLKAVAPSVFEPEPELLSEGMKDEGGRMKNEDDSVHPSSFIPHPSILATPALEVEVLGLLNSAGAFMGEQLSVTRTPEGKLLVSGLVDTAERKTELLRALASMRSNPAVRVEIQTASEAQQRQARSSSKSNPVSVSRVEANEGTSPVYNDLRQKFTDDEARRFADRILSRSTQARSHALALKQLAGRFSLTDLQTLSDSEHARWLGLLREHAASYERDAEALRRELEQVFPALAQAPAASEIRSDIEIQQAAQRLYELSVACDDQLRQSFALSANGASGTPIKTQQFWRTLAAAKALAGKISKQ